MTNFKSKITGIISRTKGRTLYLLIFQVENALHDFLFAKLEAEGKILTKDEEIELDLKKKAIIDSRSLFELDVAIYGFENLAEELVGVKPGEMEFTVATELERAFREDKEFSPEGEIFPENKKEGKVLPFNSGLRKH